MSDKQKKKIELNNVGFQWGEEKAVEVNKKDVKVKSKDAEPSLAEKIRNINNSAHEKDLTQSVVTKSRNEEQEELDKAILSLNGGISSGVKSDRDKSKSELAQALNLLSENNNQMSKKESESAIAIEVKNDKTEPLHKKDSFKIKDVKSKKSANKDSPAWITYGIPFLGVAAIVALIVVIQAKKAKSEQESSISVAQVQEIQTGDNSQDYVKKSLMVVSEKKSAAPITNLDFVNENNKVVEKKDGSLIINDDLKVTNVNPKEQVNIGEVVAVPGQTDVPTIQFVSVKENVKDNKDMLSINSVVPAPGSNSLSVLSLAQWPNAINLKEMSSDFSEIEALFPKTLYKKQDTFSGQDLLTIYDKRSVAQEKFVKLNQSCYFIPSEMGGNWMGVNYFLISYCFLNNQFIGVNMYTNAEPDVMKKVEANIKKFPYFHISSVYKGNGYNLISIEQSNAYKILEEYRIATLNNAIKK